MIKTIILRTIYVLLFIFSVFVTYQELVVNQNYEIFTNPEGPDTTDYFLTEEEI
jgi:hypothetical protein